MAKSKVTWDRYGQDIVGDDEHGAWFGTEDQPIRLDRARDWRLRRLKRFVVFGYLRAESFKAVVRARDKERVERYLTEMGVREMVFE